MDVAEAENRLAKLGLQPGMPGFNEARSDLLIRDLAENSWVRYVGPKGGKGARNTVSGDIVYGAKAEELLRQKPQEAKEEEPEERPEGKPEQPGQSRAPAKEEPAGKKWKLPDYKSLDDAAAEALVQRVRAKEDVAGVAGLPREAVEEAYRASTAALEGLSGKQREAAHLVRGSLLLAMEQAPRAGPVGGKRPKYPDGRSVPQVGDKVYLRSAGMFGTDAVIGGVVKLKGGKPVVEATGVAGMFAQTTTKKTFPLSQGWTLEGEDDPSRLQSKKFEEAERAREEDRRQREAEFMRLVDESKQRGNVHLDMVRPSLGMRVRSLRSEQTGAYTEEGRTGTIVGIQGHGPRAYAIIAWDDGTENTTGSLNDPGIVLIVEKDPQGHLRKPPRFEAKRRPNRANDVPKFKADPEVPILVGRLNKEPLFGFTLNSDLSKWSGQGYVVSVTSHNFSKDMTGVEPDDIVRFYDEVYDLLEEFPGLKIGTFSDDVGKDLISVDLNVVVKDREEAVAIAKRFDQVGIWDGYKQEFVPTGGSGENPHGRTRKPVLEALQGVRSWVDAEEEGRKS